MMAAALIQPQCHVEARPAEPILASSLVCDELDLDGIVDRIFLGTRAVKKEEGRRIGTGIARVDVAMGGGVRKRSVVGVSGNIGEGGFDICAALLATSLLSDPASTAAIIDTTGNLDVLRLYNLVRERLHPGTEHVQDQGSAEGICEDRAEKVLDRVKIMRVFDVIGVMEAIAEIREGLEGTDATGGEGVSGNKGEIEVPEKKKEERVSDQKQEVVEKVFEGQMKERRLVVSDSEGEDEDEEDEMLFEIAQPTEATLYPAIENPPEIPTEPSNPEAKMELKPLENQPISNPKTTIVLIDNLAHVLSPLLKKDYSEANALATALLRSLTNLTTTHSLIALLLNPASIPRSNSPSKPNTIQDTHSNPNQLPAPTNESEPPPPIPSPSIFLANKNIPALGNLLSPFLDVHLFVSKVPRRKADARKVAEYEDTGRGREYGYGRVGGARGAEMVGLVEVLSDRGGGSLGGWGTFVSDERGVRDL